jgi:dinuclear metal center YbgI/SA1388 family protein
MVKIRDVMEVMESWAPSSLAESWDNTGLIIGNPDNDVSHIIVTLDVTADTVTAAGSSQASMIISHHPPIFKPLYNLSGKNASTHIIAQAIKHDIALFAAHTNLDQVMDGVNCALAEKLGLQSVSFLSPGNAGYVKFVTFVPPDFTDKIREAAGSAGAGVIGKYTYCSFSSPGTGTYIPSETASPFEGHPGELSKSREDRIEMIVPSTIISRVIEAARKAHPYEEMAYDIIPLSGIQTPYGYGAVGELAEPMEPPAFIDSFARMLDCTTLRVSRARKEPIQHVAVMGGKGGDYISRAVAARADAYVTGDLGHHDFVLYGDAILLVDASHRLTELPVLEKIKGRLLSSGIGKHITVTIDYGEDITETKTYN